MKKVPKSTYGSSLSTLDPAGDASFSQINFTVDSALLTELGERLVGKPYIALAELVKNSYDADAFNCVISFGEDYIEVLDNGHGMTEEEFRDYWMRIGTTHKQQDALSRKLKRVLTGSKGIGRLAAQFLATNLHMETTSKKADVKLIECNVDWNAAVKTGELTHAHAFYRISPGGNVTFADGSKYGTRIRLTGLNHSWTKEDVRALAKEIWRLQPPLTLKRGSAKDKSQFVVSLESGDESIKQEFDQQMQAALKNWQVRIKGGIENGRATQTATVEVEFRDGEKHKEKFKIKDCAIDSVQFEIRVFNLQGRQAHGVDVHEARDYFKEFGGINVYDQGFRLPYYGSQQDWLGLEVDHSHRLFKSQLLPEHLQAPAGMRDLPTQARIFGVVEISTAHEAATMLAPKKQSGDYLSIQLTRDRLVDNKAYQDLKYAVRWAVDYYATRARLRRLREAEKALEKTKQPTERLGRAKLLLAKYESDIPQVVFRELEAELDDVIAAEKAKSRVAGEEKALLGALASAGMAAISLEHEIGKELTTLQRLVSRLGKLASGSKVEQQKQQEVITELKKWIDRVRSTRKIFAPLMDETDRQKRARLRAKAVVDQVVDNMRPLLRHIEVDTSSIPADLRLPSATMAEWNAIFQNLFTNAVNAMLDSRHPKIVCEGGRRRSTAYFLVQDTGVGVKLAKSEKLFEPFYREANISDERRALGLGGTGLGLAIVRTIGDVIGVGTEFVKPTPPFKTALQISWEEV